MWVLVWSAPKRWPQPSVGPSSWPSCPSSPSGEVIGVTRSVNPTPCPARWPDAAALSWCVSFPHPVVPASCLRLCPRSCSWWLVLMTATPPPGAALPPSATLVRHLHLSELLSFLLALPSFTLAVVLLSFFWREIIECCNARQKDFADGLFCSPFQYSTFPLVCTCVRRFKLKHLFIDFFSYQPRLPLMPSQRLTATWPLICGRRPSSPSLPTRYSMPKIDL